MNNYLSMLISPHYFRHYLSAPKNNSIWLRDFTENKIKAAKRVAFLHNILNDAIEEINGIFAIEVSKT